jgi:ABC-type bacteriocin/lantibiotic exporter with double-glycine peptidase domain
MRRTTSKTSCASIADLRGIGLRLSIPVVIAAVVAFFFPLVHAHGQSTGNGRLIDAVPFYEQEDHQCGPASLAGLLNFYGANVNPREIAEKIYSASARGTLDLDMVFYAERKGMSARQYRGSLEDLKKNIDAGTPLIILVDYGFLVYQKNHYMVVVGYSDTGIIVNSGKEHLKTIAANDLKGPWERAGYWTMTVAPKGRK